MTPLFKRLNLGSQPVIHVLDATASFEAELAALRAFESSAPSLADARLPWLSWSLRHSSMTRVQDLRLRVFVSGTTPLDPKTGAITGQTIQEQTHQCLTNISAILVAAGTLAKVVSATVILVEEDDFAGMNEEWVKWFSSSPPARQAAKLPVNIPGLKVSIACIAEA
ncbi:MAG: RidA family protein [Pseudomonadota bacterium]|nr:RidA family protein [Pseudomonadota bacterium]